MNGTAHSQRTMSHDPSNVDSTLRMLDLRHELADVKDRLRQSIDLLELSRDTIVQLRSYSTSLEQLCMWSEASWRSIAQDLLHSQCASTWLSLKGSLLSRPVTTST
ncbi:Hypothetical protein, putative [Bodo saltans]|uniref:Uncharacterized protein n=1 Tax=Bodo saltans TaxID=75058 RepID=A0A0S4IZS4_BODSA|nr:Hypothetical protein, putative [Bodo saltans]|eukprot:CUG29980.1 Hypothetical protein, putative [Bodo saltans]